MSINPGEPSIEEPSSINSLNNYPSSSEYVDQSKNDWKMPDYSSLKNLCGKEIPPLIEEIDFGRCRESSNPSANKNVAFEKDDNIQDQDKLSKIARKKHSNTVFNQNHKLQLDFDQGHNSENNLSDSYSYYDEDSDSGKAIIDLPPPLEIGMEMPSVPEPDIFDVFDFQLPYMPNPSDDDQKYIQQIDERFDREKLLSEIKSH